MRIPFVKAPLGGEEEKYLLETCDAINHHLDPEWTALSPWHEASVTIETLLAMTTGMDEQLRPLGEVGGEWRYNNTAYNYLKKILCLHTGLSLNELSREWLFNPLGMKNTRWEAREQKLPDGTAITGLQSTADDLAKIGRLVLNDGVWNVRSSRSHSPPELAANSYMQASSQKSARLSAAK